MGRAQQFHDMTSPELRQKHADLKNELFNLRFQQTTGQLKNPLALRTVRKDIARIMTILNERELNIQKNPGKQAAAKKAPVKAAVAPTKTEPTKKAAPATGGKK